MTGATQPAVADRERRGYERVLSEVPLHAILLPAYPVLLLYADNVVDITPVEAAGPLVAVMAVAATLLAILGKVLGSWPRAGLVVVATIVPFLLAGLVVDALEADWPDDFLFRLHGIVVALWLAVVGVGVYVALKLRRWLGAATQLLNLVAVVLLVLVTIPIAGDIRLRGAPETVGASAATDGLPDPAAAQLAGRDIYHLVFDRYGSEASLELGRGIDNSEFMGWLRDRGFAVVDDARANFERTALSLSAVHEMGLHEDLVASGSADYDDLVARIRNSRAAATLKDLGYEYVVSGSWWGPSAFSPIADRVIQPRYVMSFGSALVDRSLLPSLEHLAALVTRRSIDGSERYMAVTTRNQFAALHTLIPEPGPKFVFAHLLVPHDPYVFLADGTVDGSMATYDTQLAYTNAELRTLIEALLALPPAEQPIIVLQADEGPYPERYEVGRDRFDWSTASGEELVTKFGVLNAFYLPGVEGEAPLPDGLSLVNTFPEILDRYHGLDVERAPDATYGMVQGDYFSLIDLTEQVEDAFDEVDSD